MKKEITAEDIIKAIEEMFDEEKVQENETFWRGFRYGIMRTQQYIDKLNQELQRKDNNWNELKEYLEKEMKIWDKSIYIVYKEVLDKIEELEKM